MRNDVLKWWHVEDDGKTGQTVKAEPEHCRSPKIVVHQCFGEEHASIMFTTSGDNEEKIVIADILIPWHVGIDPCSQCGGSCHHFDGKTDTMHRCLWCISGKSVMDEAIRVAEMLYVGWLRESKVAKLREDFLHEGEDR